MLPLLASFVLAQTFSIDRVTVTPAMKGLVPRGVVEAALPALEKCKWVGPLSKGDDTDDRVRITFKLPLATARIDVSGEVDTECVKELVKTWKFPRGDAQVEVLLRAKLDFEESRRQTEQTVSDLKRACATILKELGNKPPANFEALFDAVDAARRELATHTFPTGRENRRAYVNMLADCPPADFGLLLDSALGDLRVTDETCTKVLGWLKRPRDKSP